MNFDRTSIEPLVVQAREAFEQQRMRECVALIRTVLSADPENSEAKSLQSSIQLQVNRDLHDARALLEDSRTRDDGQKYRKAAEIILLKALNVDPASQEAMALLSLARGSSDSWSPSGSSAEADDYGESQPHEGLQFTVGASSGDPATESASFRFPVVFAVIIAIAGVLSVAGYSLLKDHGTESVAALTPAYPSNIASAAPAPRPQQRPREVLPKEQLRAPEPIATSAMNIRPDAAAPTAPVPVPGPTAAEPGPTPNPDTPEPPAAPQETGMLAVSSLLPADIYRNNKYLGSTPTTLKLPAGRQTLEYRHQDLRAVATHNVKARQTATALITFETVVQINARPWAQVFLDGSTRRPLGQTPLSNVRVPIGGVLVFENPNFPAKNHPVTAKDTGIQVVFP